MRTCLSLIVALLCMLPHTLHAAELPAEDVRFFEEKIRPILIQQCYECHSAEAAQAGKLQGGLQLDTREGLLKGGDSGSAVSPGDEQGSLLMQSLRYESFEMPPKQPLPAEVIADFATWIARGAADPRDGSPVITKPVLDLEAARQFWSLQPIKKHEPPAVADAAWQANPIDAFVRAKLDEHQLAPVPPAERAQLLRRLSFDLTGIPPTPEEVAAFVADTSPDAVETVVDRLLASPGFGERWGRHWLDVARYSDSCGSTRNMVWFHAWRYRDFVIDSLNADMPYDQFLREQVAGDLLPAATPADRDRQRTATGFLALGPKALDEAKRNLFQMDLIDEQIDVLSRSVLGLSVSCARCHDHKFDPIPTADYYALAGVFKSTQPLHGSGPMGIRGQHDTELHLLGDDQAGLAGPFADHLARVKAMNQAFNDTRSERYGDVRKLADVKQRLTAPDAKQEELQAEVEQLEAVIRDWDAKVAQMQGELDALMDARPPEPPLAMGVREAETPENVAIHIRGEVTNLGEIVPRGLLQVIPVAAPTIGPHESGRLQLATWLTDPRNPLPARVMVNRVWLHLLGSGLVTTPDDLGTSGARPSHPELLDHLAAGFIEEGWSLKRLVRRIVLSRTYQLSSQPLAANEAVDPDNVWLWRMRPRRLEAEPLRDAVLSVAGVLRSEPGQPRALAALDRFRQNEFNFALALKPDEIEGGQRSVYLPVVRGDLPPVLKVFDAADPNRPIGQRDTTIVPAQAAFSLNSAWMIGYARKTAERLLSESLADDAARLDRLFHLALSRAPTDVERQQLLAYLAASGPSEAPDSPGAGGSIDPIERWTSVCQIVLSSAEFQFLQ